LNAEHTDPGSRIPDPGKDPPRILLLSATTGYQLRSFNDAAARLGVELAFATDRCHTLDDPWQDAALPVRFHEEAESVTRIVDAAAARPFAGVVAVGDRPTMLAARAAEALGLPGHPPEAVRASSSKLGARQRFAAAGLWTPWFLVIPERESAERFALDPRIAYPCVLKPTSLSGSRGVIRADDPAGFAAALVRIRALLDRHEVRALRHPDARQVIVEGFVAGREYAVEGVLSEGRLHALAVFDKPDPLDGPFFEETIYVTPSDAGEAGQRAILETVQQAVRALGLRHGAVHAECRVDGADVVMLEVAPRPIGGLCSRVLRFVPPGSNATISLEELLLRHALGEDVTAWRREPAAAAVMMIPIPRRGHLGRVRGESEARAVPHVEDLRITARRGQLLEPLPEAGSYLGFIFARAASAAEADAAVRRAHHHLSFAIDPAIGVSPA
jgi:biotin carboxylase